MAGEHGLWWKCSFYEGSSRIPFIVAWPRRFTPGRRTRLTSLVDLTRTVLDLAGCEPHAADLDGAVLTDVLDGSAPDGGGIAISEYYAHGTDRPARMLRHGNFKLNYYLGEPVELFDLATDPAEFHELSRSSPTPRSATSCPPSPSATGTGRHRPPGPREPASGAPSSRAAHPLLRPLGPSPTTTGPRVPQLAAVTD